MYPAHIKDDGSVQTCSEHCENVAESTKNNLLNIGLGNTGYLAGLVHDCGKFTDEFSAYLKKAVNGENVRRGSVIHSFAGVGLLLNLSHNKEDLSQMLASEILACTVGSHHGLFDCYDENTCSGFDYRLTKQPEYDTKAINHFFSECTEKTELESLFEKAVGEIATAKKTISDLCKSSGRKAKDAFFMLALLTRTITSALVDADRSDTASFMGNSFIVSDADASRLWDECLKKLAEYTDKFPQETEIQSARRSLSDLCAEAADVPTGIYKLDLPTGGGKTLSSIRFALLHAAKKNKKRIFYISPLLSILDQNADVIRKAIGHNDMILEHHSDVLNEDKAGEELQKYELLTESWNCPIIITTFVQFLNTLFSGKMSSVRRFHSLQDSVIIIDEVQTVPEKMLTLFNLALDFLSGMCGTTFVLCSATQPEFEKIPHPIKATELLPKNKLAKYEAVFKRNMIIDKGKCKFEGIPKHILSILQYNQNVLVVCNKKSESAELFRTVEALGIRAVHLSAGMCMAHRKCALDEIKALLSAKEKFVCISTQVIEAGVDISFDSVIRLSAGLDSIVQSAGRCNRNGENEALSPVWVIDCSDEKLSRLKEIKEAKTATAALLDAYGRNSEEFENDLSSNSAVRFYYEKLFSGKDAGFSDFPSEGYSIYSMLSDNVQWCRNSKYVINQAFRSAGEAFSVFDSDQKTVIVPYAEGKSIIEELHQGKIENLKSLIEKAKPYTVSLYEYHFKALQEIGAIRLLFDGTVAVLAEEYYNENTGIKEANEECSTQIW